MTKMPTVYLTNEEISKLNDVMQDHKYECKICKNSFRYMTVETEKSMCKNCNNYIYNTDYKATEKQKKLRFKNEIKRRLEIKK